MKVITTLEDREKTHGHFPQVASCAQELKNTIRVFAGRNLTSVQMEALENDAQKTARILCGDPDTLDHWLDKAGYALLVYQALGGDLNDAPFAVLPRKSHEEFLETDPPEPGGIAVHLPLFDCLAPSGQPPSESEA